MPPHIMPVNNANIGNTNFEYQVINKVLMHAAAFASNGAQASKPPTWSPKRGGGMCSTCLGLPGSQPDPKQNKKPRPPPVAPPTPCANKTAILISYYYVYFDQMPR